jgi:hypothetical protein
MCWCQRFFFNDYQQGDGGFLETYGSSLPSCSTVQYKHANELM